MGIGGRDTLRPMAIRLWILCMLLSVGMLAPVAARSADIPTVELTSARDGPDLARFVRYTVHLGEIGESSATDLLSATGSSFEGPDIHFGPPGKKTTAIIKVRNSGSKQGSWIFTTGRGSLTYFRLYQSSGGPLELLVDGRDRAGASANLFIYQAFSTELVLEPGQEKYLVVDFLSDNSTYLPLKIQTYGTFFKERRLNIAMVTAMVVGALILTFLNMIFFSVSGHREFAWLALAQAFYMINTIHSEGYLTIFFFANHPVVSVAVEDMFKCGFAAAMAQFGRSFIQTRSHFPRRDLALRVLIGGSVVTMLLQLGLGAYPASVQTALHLTAWLLAASIALYLPFVGFAAMRRHGRQLWPLALGWTSLALFIVYAAVASLGVFKWLPINWHLAGPVGLFDAIMVTIALGLNLRKIREEKVAADEKVAQSLAERVRISEAAAHLAEEKAAAIASLNSQNALLHASGHDSKQVILALNSAISVLDQADASIDRNRDLRTMLRSSAEYLEQIVATTMAGATIGGEASFRALSAFDGDLLLEPLLMMFKTAFAQKKLVLTTECPEPICLITDRPLLTRAIANLLSNAYEYSERGGARLVLVREGRDAVIDVIDSGLGIAPDVIKALDHPDSERLRAGDSIQGSGSGYRTTRRLVEAIGGGIAITSSGPAGTAIRLRVPGAFAALTPCGLHDIQRRQPRWEILDYDDRAAYEHSIAHMRNPQHWVAAVTHDDSTVTRGRLGKEVGIMLIKPLMLEMAEHPLLAGDQSNPSS